MNRSAKKQTGTTLVVSLLMLIVLTLLAVTAINTTIMDLRIARNMQAKQETEAAAQEAIEQVISSIANFNTPTDQTITVNGLTVAVAAPQCLGERPALGYSATWGLAPQDTHWEVAASASDNNLTPAARTGARTTIHQGIEIRLPAGSCP